MKECKRSLLVVSGGGTGGHLFPALAVVEAVQSLKPQQEIVFIGKAAERDRMEVEQRGIPFLGLRLMGLKRKFSRENIQALWLLWQGTGKAKKMMKSYMNGVVFGVGGYVSAPAMIAGKRLGWRVCLHEQNTIPGLVNRTMARWCDRVYITFVMSRTHIRSASCVLSGFPLRKSLVDAAEQKHSRFREHSIPHILVIGGSQGAKRLVETVHQVFRGLEEEETDYTATVQTGERNYESAAAWDWSEKVEIVPFIHDMASAYQRADIIISRAGAGSLFEIALFGIPAILVPYPYASGHHQEWNAKVWEEAGAARVLCEAELSPQRLKNELTGLIHHEGIRKDMHGSAASLARSDAARTIARDLIEMLESAS